VLRRVAKVTLAAFFAVLGWAARPMLRAVRTGAFSCPAC
jgi:hypothetical protein